MIKFMLVVFVVINQSGDVEIIHGLREDTCNAMKTALAERHKGDFFVHCVPYQAGAE
jgi:hypothetical protein